VKCGAWSVQYGVHSANYGLCGGECRVWSVKFNVGSGEYGVQV